MSPLTRGWDTDFRGSGLKADGFFSSYAFNNSFLIFYVRGKNPCPIKKDR